MTRCYSGFSGLSEKSAIRGDGGGSLELEWIGQGEKDGRDSGLDAVGPEETTLEILYCIRSINH